MNHPVTAIVAAAVSAGVTVWLTKFITKLKESRSLAEGEGWIEENINIARTAGWFDGHDWLWQKLIDAGVDPEILDRVVKK